MHRFRILGLVSLTSVLATAAAQGQEAAEPKPSAVTAQPQANEGKATIRCVIVARRKLDQCTVLSEEPLGAGFGEMALRMSKEMRSTAPRGGALIIPIEFKKPAATRRH